MRQGAFVRLIEEHRPRLIKIAESLVGEHAAKDVVQITLLSVHKSRDWRDMGEKEFKKFLTRAVQNDAKNYLQAQHRAFDREMAFAARLPLDESERDDAIDVRHAMARLPEDVQRAVYAIHVEGASEREVAEELGIPQTSLRRLVKAGLDDLRRDLGANAPAARLQEPRAHDEEVA